MSSAEIFTKVLSVKPNVWFFLIIIQTHQLSCFRLTWRHRVRLITRIFHWYHPTSINVFLFFWMQIKVDSSTVVRRNCLVILSILRWCNNLRHQHNDMHIAAAVSFVRIYAKRKKSIKSLCAQNMSILVEYFTKNYRHTHPVYYGYFSHLYLTLLSPASHKWDIGKQCRPRSDAAERGVWSGYTLFGLSSKVSSKHGNKKTNQTPII